MSTAEVPAVMVASEREAEEEILKLGGGWNITPYDEPERGVLGYILFREKTADEYGRILAAAPGTPPEQPEEYRWFAWPMFRRPLEADDRRVSFQELLTFMEEERETILGCDDPKARLIGFVSYRNASEGKSIVRRVALTDVKASSDELRTRFMQIREGIRAHARGRQHQRTLAAAALQSASNLI